MNLPPGVEGSSKRPGRDSRSILANAFSGYVSKVVDLVVALLLIPFMVHQLGDLDYGLWILIGSVVAYGFLLDFGVANAVTRYVAEYRATNRADDARRLVASAIWLYIVIGLALLIFFLAIAGAVPGWLGLAAEQHARASKLVVLSGTAVGLSIPFAASIAVLKGLHRFDIANFLGMARFLFFAIGTVAVLTLGGGVISVAIVHLISICLMQVAAIGFVRNLAPELRFGLRGAHLEGLKTVASFSWSLFFVNIGGQLQSKTDEIVIGANMQVANVTPYSLAQKLSRIPQDFAEQFINLILPIASEMQANKQMDQLQMTYIVSSRLTLAVFFSVGIVLAALAAPLLSIWVGTEYSVYAPLVWLLVAAACLDTAQWPAAMVLQGMNRHRIFAATSLATGLANIGLSIALIPYFGLIGVALGTVIPAAIELFLVIVPFALHVVGVPVTRLLRETVLPSIIPSIAPVFVLGFSAVYMEEMGILTLILVALIAVVAYAGVYIAYPTNHVERKAAAMFLAAVRNRIQTG